MMVRIASIKDGLRVIVGCEDYIVDKVIINEKELTDKIVGERIIYVDALYVEVMKDKILIHAPSNGE